MDNKDFHSIIRNALTNHLFELNQSCYEQPECKKATSKCVDYLDSNLIDEQWLLNNHLVVYSICCLNLCAIDSLRTHFVYSVCSSSVHSDSGFLKFRTSGLKFFIIYPA